MQICTTNNFDSKVLASVNMLSCHVMVQSGGGCTLKQGQKKMKKSRKTPSSASWEGKGSMASQILVTMQRRKRGTVQ
jgi:hypothetical protein